MFYLGALGRIIKVHRYKYMDRIVWDWNMYLPTCCSHLIYSSWVVNYNLWRLCLCYMWQGRHEIYAYFSTLTLLCLQLKLKLSICGIFYFFKWANPGLFWFIFVFSTLHKSMHRWKQKWCVWDWNPGRQDGRRRRIHWAMAATQWHLLLTIRYCGRSNL